MSFLSLSQEKKVTIAIVLLFLVFASYKITRLPTDLHQYRQTQTLSTVYNYYKSGINLFKPEIDINGSHSVIILEFPLYQAVLASLMKVLGYSELLGRLLNILATVITGLLLAKISEEFVLKDSFLFTLISFLFTPSTIFWSSTLLIDPFALCFAIASAYIFCFWFKSNKKSKLILATILGVIATLIKVTSAFIPLGIFYSCSFFYKLKKQKKLPWMLIFSAITIAAFFLAWHEYSNYINKINPHGYINAGVDWYLGTFNQRFSAHSWAALIKATIHNNFFFLSIFGLLVTGILKRNLKDKTFIISAVCFFYIILYLFIFINLNFIHTYYQLPINAANAIIGGVGITHLLLRFNFQFNFKMWSMVIVLLLLALAVNKVLHGGKWKDWSTSAPYAQHNCEWQMGKQIYNYLDDLDINTNLVGVVIDMAEPCWNGPHALMYYIKRRGYIVKDINDPSLSKEPLDLIIAIYKDKKTPINKNWVPMVTKPLRGLAKEYDFTIFVPHRFPLKATRKFIYNKQDKSIEGTPTISGSAHEHFNTKLKIHDLKIPAYSKVNIRFKAKLVDGVEPNGNPGYLTMRTYTGGYSFDSSRPIHFENNGIKAFSFWIMTDRFNDYVLEFGQIKEGGFEIVDPINLTYHSIF